MQVSESAVTELEINFMVTETHTGTKTVLGLLAGCRPTLRDSPHYLNKSDVLISEEHGNSTTTIFKAHITHLFDWNQRVNAGKTHVILPHVFSEMFDVMRSSLPLAPHWSTNTASFQAFSACLPAARHTAATSWCGGPVGRCYNPIRLNVGVSYR